MPFSAEEITELGYSSLNYYLRNNPIDQIKQRRPLLRKLMAKKMSFPGGNDSVVEQVRKSYDSNFQWFQGEDAVDYNVKNTLDQVKYPWKGAHDGFKMSEDYLLSNGITVTDSGSPSVNSRGERLRLTNLFREAVETLRLGFEEQLDYALHITAPAAEEIDGLESLIALDPTTGIVGGVDRSTNTWWRNQVATGLVAADIVEGMEAMWRRCIINGGAPDCILVGANFADVYKEAASGLISRYAVQNTSFDTPTEMDASIRQKSDGTYTGLHFQGVPLTYDPTFEVIDAATSPTTPFSDRCYFINTNHLKLRPAEGHDMIARKPPRAYNYYVHRWGLTWKGALTMNRSNCHGVAAI